MISILLFVFFLINFFSVLSPLDEIIDKLGGPSCVAEMTGRRGRIVRLHPGGQPRYQARESDSSNVDSLNIQEVRTTLLFSKYVKIVC